MGGLGPRHSSSPPGWRHRVRSSGNCCGTGACPAGDRPGVPGRPHHHPGPAAAQRETRFRAGRPGCRAGPWPDAVGAKPRLRDPYRAARFQPLRRRARRRPGSGRGPTRSRYPLPGRPGCGRAGPDGLSPDGPMGDHAPREEAPAENGAPAGEWCGPGTLQAWGSNGGRTASARPRPAPATRAEKPPKNSDERRTATTPRRGAPPGQARQRTSRLPGPDDTGR